jgi:hypothetical protein
VPEIEASRFAGRAPAPGPAPDLAPPPGPAPATAAPPAPATAAPPAPASGAADALRDRARRIAGPVISEDERRRLDEAAARR